MLLRKPFSRTELLGAVATAARLTPVPDAIGADNPALDEANLADLRRNVGQAAFDGHLEAAAGRIADLLTLLERPNAADDPTVRDAVHDLIGVSGLLGLTVLGSGLRRFDIASDRTGSGGGVAGVRGGRAGGTAAEAGAGGIRMIETFRGRFIPTRAVPDAFGKIMASKFCSASLRLRRMVGVLQWVARTKDSTSFLQKKKQKTFIS